MLKHKLLHISSKHRVQGPSTSDFIVNFKNSTGVQECKSLVLKQISIPNAMYNITEHNRTFTYNIASSPTSVQIPVGQYDITAFMTALQTALSAVGATITQNAVTQKIEFATTTNIEYLDITENPMADVIGILLNEGSGADVATFDATGLPSLEGLHNIFVESRQLGESNLIRSGTDSTLNTIAIIPVDQPYSGVIHYTSDHPSIDDYDAVSRAHGKPIQSIEIKLTDHEGRVIDLNGHHISLTLKMYY